MDKRIEALDALLANWPSDTWVADQFAAAWRTWLREAAIRGMATRDAAMSTEGRQESSDFALEKSNG